MDNKATSITHAVIILCAGRTGQLPRLATFPTSFVSPISAFTLSIAFTQTSLHHGATLRACLTRRLMDARQHEPQSILTNFIRLCDWLHRVLYSTRLLRLLLEKLNGLGSEAASRSPCDNGGPLSLTHVHKRRGKNQGQFALPCCLNLCISTDYGLPAY